MAKKTAQESDEARLKKKIATNLTDQKGRGNPALRALRKRLKRIQRKRRAVALRKKHAAGQKTEAAAPAATT